MLDLAQATAALATTAKSIDVDHLGTGAVLAVVVTEVIEWAKRSGWGWLSAINADSTTLNRWVGGAVALLVGLGISWTYDPSTGTLIINGLLASSITHGIAQWAQQQAYYRLFVANKGITVAPPAVGGGTLPGAVPHDAAHASSRGEGSN